MFDCFQAASVKKAVKRGLTQRLRERVGMGDSDSSDEEKESVEKKNKDAEEATLEGDGIWEKDYAPGTARSSKKKTSRGQGKPARSASGARDIELGVIDDHKETIEEGKKTGRSTFQLPKAAASMVSMSMLEQSMPADAVLAKEGAEEVRCLPQILPVYFVLKSCIFTSFYRILTRQLCRWES